MMYANAPLTQRREKVSVIAPGGNVTHVAFGDGAQSGAKGVVGEGRRSSES